MVHFAWETVSILDAAERSIRPTKRAAKKEREGLLSPQTHLSLFADGLFPRLNQVEFEGQPRGVISEEAAAAFVQCPWGTVDLVYCPL